MSLSSLCRCRHRVTTIHPYLDRYTLTRYHSTHEKYRQNKGSESPPSYQSVLFLDHSLSSSLSSPSSSNIDNLIYRISHHQLIPRNIPPTHLLVKVDSVGINPLDIMSREGYGNTLISLAAPLPRILGRECSGTIIQLGQNVWDYKVGDKVWVSRHPLRSGTFAQYIVVQEDELSLSPQSLSAYESAAYPFIFTTLWTALVDTAKIQPTNNSHRDRPYTPYRATETDLGSFSSSSSSPRSAFIHGAGGPLGTLACHLLYYWGWSITATVKQGQETARIKPYTQAIIHVNPREEEQYQRDKDKERDRDTHSFTTRALPSWFAEIPLSSSSSSSSSPQSYSLYLDCVGGPLSESVSLSILSSPGGHYVSLRGPLVSLFDEYGLLGGMKNTMIELMTKKSQFASMGLLYDWIVNQPRATALQYLTTLIDIQHHDAQHHNSDTSLFQVPVCKPRWTGVDGVINALKEYQRNKTQSKLVVQIDTSQ